MISAYFLFAAGLQDAVHPTTASCDKELLEVQYDCLSSIGSVPSPLIDDAKLASTVVADCAHDVKKCLGIWRGINFVLGQGDGFGWFGLQAIPKRFGTEKDWSVMCRKDEITDERTCVLKPKGDYEVLRVVYDRSLTKKHIMLANQGKSFPGSSVSIRIDERKAHTIGENQLLSTAASKIALQQMTNGKLARIRYYDWPYNEPHNFEVNLVMFTEVLPLAEAVVAEYFKGR